MNLSIFTRFRVSLIALLFSCAALSIPSYAQLNDFENNFINFNQQHLNEKIYLHTDRSFYICGEILWFKAYVTGAANNEPLPVSKVMYVELLNLKNEPVLQQKIAVKGGFGNGSIALPFSISSGNYQLRAYTNWMKNFSAEDFFRKSIVVVNTRKNLDSAAIFSPVDYTAAFFPEGGNLVNGLRSQVAFKLTDHRNKGVDGQGIIVNESNDTVAVFNTKHAGMGHFYITPVTGETYRAVLTLKGGHLLKKDLPKAYDGGYVMHVGDTEANQIKVSVAVAGVNVSHQVYTIYENSGHLNVKSIRIERGTGALLIDRDSLQEGITRITVLDENKQPKCERLYFKRPDTRLGILPTINNKNLRLRTKVLVDVATTNGAGRLLPANLSVSVFRLDGLHRQDEEDIFSYLWLSSHLQGRVETPEYYLSDKNAETDDALNDLLLTHGWRKFDWDNTKKVNRPVFTYVPEYAGHIITGRVKNDNTNRPVPGVLVYLSVPGRRVQLKGCISDSAGYVSFDMKDFTSSSQIVLQTNDGQNTKYHIEIYSPYSESFSEDALSALHLSESDEEALRQSNFHMQVQNGYLQKELAKNEDISIDTLPFYYKPTKRYILDNYTRFTTMEEVMREYVNEISVRRSGNNFRFLTLNEPAAEFRNKQPVDVLLNTNPLVLLDGVPVFNIDKIIAYDPLKVQKLEVVASRYYWGQIIADGIVSYTTYEATLKDYTLDPNDIVLDYDGLQQQRIFYSPDYAIDKALQSPIPDYRDVLLWVPDIATDKNGKAIFSFYTGDLPGNYMVVVQGIAADGEAGSASAIINVEK